MVGPSKTTQPFGIGSPRPGMRRSASMRPMLEGKAFDGMRILLLRTVRREGNPFGAGPTPPPRKDSLPQSTATNFRGLAARIVQDHRTFDPTGSAASGLHRFDGILPDYSAAALNRYVARSRKDLDALARLERTDGLSRAARLELRVLPRPGRRRADERGRNVRAEAPGGVSHDDLQTKDQDRLRTRAAEVRADDLCRTPRRDPPGPPHRGRTGGPPRKPGGLREDREENRS